MTFLDNIIKDYERDVHDLERVFKIVKKINNSNVKVLFESIIIDKILFLNKLIKNIKAVNDEELRGEK